MTASLPGGLLERMLSLTEALLVILGKPATTASATYENGCQDERAMSLHQDISHEQGSKTRTTMFTSLIPKSICSDQTPKQSETHKRNSSVNAAGISTTTTICHSSSTPQYVTGSTGEQKQLQRGPLPGFRPQQVIGTCAQILTITQQWNWFDFLLLLWRSESPYPRPH